MDDRVQALDELRLTVRVTAGELRTHLAGNHAGAATGERHLRPLGDGERDRSDRTRQETKPHRFQNSHELSSSRSVPIGPVI